MTIEEKSENLIKYGPTRVVIDSDGYAVPPMKAWKQHNVFPDIIFVRDDGWSLGAPSVYEEVAYNMWKDAWTHFLRRPNLELVSIQEYVAQYN